MDKTANLYGALACNQLKVENENGQILDEYGTPSGLPIIIKSVPVQPSNGAVLLRRNGANKY